MADNTLVPDKLYAYTLQVRHMMYELISIDSDRIVSVEAIDDVAIETDEKIIAEQIKSVQSSNNPLTDRATVFWKTLYNWWQYVVSGKLVLEKTVFRMIIISNRTLTTGVIPESFTTADNIDAAREALQKAKETLWGIEEELRKNIPDDYAPYLNTLFDNGNALDVEKIIKAMQIEVHPSDYDDKLYKKFSGLPIPQEYAQELFIYMLGWVYEQVNDQTKTGTPAYIQCGHFRDTLQAQIRRYNQSATLAWATTSPSEQEAQREFKRYDVYIRQLGLIQLDISDKLQAASDYLRTSSEKTIWAEQGIVAPQSFSDYYDSLVRMWRNQSRLVALSQSGTVVDNGKRVYFTCQEQVRTIRVQGMDAPESFGVGSLHTLANNPTDDPLIGWHPSYKELLRAGDSHE